MSYRTKIKDNFKIIWQYFYQHQNSEIFYLDINILKHLKWSYKIIFIYFFFPTNGLLNKYFTIIGHTDNHIEMNNMREVTTKPPKVFPA